MNGFLYAAGDTEWVRDDAFAPMEVEEVPSPAETPAHERAMARVRYCRCCNLTAPNGYRHSELLCDACATLIAAVHDAAAQYLARLDRIGAEHAAAHQASAQIREMAADALFAALSADADPDAAPAYQMSASERQIARARPEIEWLCAMAPAQRRFYAARRASLEQMCPEVSASAWDTLLGAQQVTA